VTPQEIFDKVATHLLTQRHRAADCFGHCMYRGLAGASCAVGCLIPDELYDASFEHHGVATVANRLLRQLPWMAENLSLLSRLQAVHDHDEAYDWPVRLKAVAGAFSLSDAVVERFLAAGWPE
jgi:hypothetical protein